MNLRRVTVFLFLMVCAVALPAPAWAADPAARQDEAAHTAFNDGRYQEAVKVYEQMAQQAPGDPDVLYDLGTAYARAGQHGLAIWRYLQALRLDPRDYDLRANLEILSPGIFQQLAVTPIPPINWLYQCFTTNEWAGAAGTAAIVAMLLGTAYFLHLHRTRWGGAARGTILTLLIFSAVAYPFAFTHYFFEDQAWRGVVVAEDTVARSGPSASQIETDRLPVGTVVRILESTQGGWLKFSYAGGRMGFVEQNRVKSL
jgi:hypothetical protein